MDDLVLLLEVFKVQTIALDIHEDHVLVQFFLEHPNWMVYLEDENTIFFGRSTPKLSNQQSKNYNERNLNEKPSDNNPNPIVFITTTLPLGRFVNNGHSQPNHPGDQPDTSTMESSWHPTDGIWTGHKHPG